MKKILGLDLGTNSIGWAVVNEAETKDEKSSIIKLGVRTISYDNFVNTNTGSESKDPEADFKGGKSISCNAKRTKKRSARRNLQRYKSRRKKLIEIMLQHGLIDENTTLCEDGKSTTYETYKLRAKAVTEEITLEELARVLLMISKKRGYKSNRKTNKTDSGNLIDGIEVAKYLYERGITPGQYTLELLESGNKLIPDFYRADIQTEFDRIWDYQKQFYSDILTDTLKEKLSGKDSKQTQIICYETFDIVGVKRSVKGKELKLENYRWRSESLVKKVDLEKLAVIFVDINTQINKSSGYLNAISERSKQLLFNDLTVGQYKYNKLINNSHDGLKNKVFYRNDYQDIENGEFEKIWNKQAEFHKELTIELKDKIRNEIIFFQRPLKSQKGLVGFCEFESKQVEVVVNGKKKTKKMGLRVCPKSSPLFQEFKIWQILNNVKLYCGKSYNRYLTQEEKEILFKELDVKTKLTKNDALKLLFENSNELDLNYRELEGNTTKAKLYAVFQDIVDLSGHGEHDFPKMPADEINELLETVFDGLGVETGILHFNVELEGKDFEKQPYYLLWHLLYSYECDNSNTGDEKLIELLTEKFNFEKEYATILAHITFESDYGNLSAKAIRKILPYMKDGFEYSEACEYAGYRHSKNSLTRDELDNKVYKDKLDSVPMNSLRNPVVEKILNQMVNVVNSVFETYGKPDEIRIELARELKKSSKERIELDKAIRKSTNEQENIKKKMTVRKKPIFFLVWYWKIL